VLGMAASVPLARTDSNMAVAALYLSWALAALGTMRAAVTVAVCTIVSVVVVVVRTVEVLRAMLLSVDHLVL
jgi:hypothetical protein